MEYKYITYTSLRLINVKEEHNNFHKMSRLLLVMFNYLAQHLRGKELF